VPESMVTVLVASEDSAQRLDRFLNNHLSDLSRTRIKSLIEAGCTSIDGQIVKDPNYRVKTGSNIRLNVPAPVEARPEPQNIPLDIVHEDSHLIVLNKPAGLVVHPGAGNPDGTLVNALLAHCGDSLRGIGGVKRPGIVHRIDKDTSGLMVAAKTEVAHHGLSELFASHDIERRYDALTWGVPSPLSGIVTGAIGRSSRNRKKMSVVEFGGKHATTHYRVVSSFGMLASHVSCELETGRTHQIRVHMTSLGHSLIGDQLYGRATKRGAPEAIGSAVRNFNRQALHAATLGFIHPVTEKAFRFEAPHPTDFELLIEELERYARL
jgi:23S rRNA pseudouridine1911/1915/1917 synthase